jgi:DNA polymerase III subunit gamma/tau
MTLYLKYRPQKIEDLDLTDVRDMLSAILKTENIPHAFLFVGPRGLGKTSSARILAKAVNCKNKDKSGEPCNECEVCIGITAGSNPDVIEIDAASNRGIDEIRTLRDNIKLSPMSLKLKVYIIDEVHMLTTEAANALLKTLEEPPAHAIFILATTDPQKLPATVVSRCTVVNFKIPTLEEAVSRLEKVTRGEGVKADKKGLELIAQAGRGSFRDEIKILEQIIISSEKVTEESVRQQLGMLESADPEKFIEILNSRDVEGGLEFIKSLNENGVNIRTFIERTIEVLRLQLLDKKDSSLINLIESLDRAFEQSRTSAVPQLPLEILVLQITNDKGQVPEKPQEKKVEPKKETVMEKPVSEHKVSNIKGKYKLDDVVAKWSDILKEVRPKNHSVEALLRSTSPIDFDGQDLQLEVFYKFHKDKLETDKCRSIVEEAVGNVFSIGPVRLKLKLGIRQKKEELTAENVGDDIVKAAADIFKIEAV